MANNTKELMQISIFTMVELKILLTYFIHNIFKFSSILNKLIRFTNSWSSLPREFDIDYLIDTTRICFQHYNSVTQINCFFNIIRDKHNCALFLLPYPQNFFLLYRAHRLLRQVREFVYSLPYYELMILFEVVLLITLVV